MPTKWMKTVSLMQGTSNVYNNSNFAPSLSFCGLAMYFAKRHISLSLQCCQIWVNFPIWGNLRYELGIIKHRGEIPQTLYFGGNLDLPGNIWIFSSV
jgi:hypothetical protein